METLIVVLIVAVVISAILYLIADRAWRRLFK